MAVINTVMLIFLVNWEAEPKVPISPMEMLLEGE
jgi:hypothetical protein